MRGFAAGTFVSARMRGTSAHGAWLLLLFAPCTALNLAVRAPAGAARLPTAECSFESAIKLCSAAAEYALSGRPVAMERLAEVPQLLRHVFDSDEQRVLGGYSSRFLQNVTCMKPADFARGYQLFDEDLAALPLVPGRRCHGGDCCNKCSRVLLPAFATQEECATLRERASALMPPEDELPHHNMYLKASAATGDVRTTLSFLRLIERMRRVIAHEYGIPLVRLAPRQTFISRICDAAEVDWQSLHADESSVPSFHYSCVLYLSTHGVDFAGGGFAFCDPAADYRLAAKGERELHRLHPEAGMAVIFSSGWENMHLVEPLHGGRRFAVPAFFETRDPARDGEQIGIFDDDVAAAEALWRCALMPESEADFLQTFQRWHSLLAVG